MNHQAKTSNRREMLGCAREAAYLRRTGKIAEAAEWEARAAARLQKLNGLMGNW